MCLWQGPAVPYGLIQEDADSVVAEAHKREFQSLRWAISLAFLTIRMPKLEQMWLWAEVNPISVLGGGRLVRGLVMASLFMRASPMSIFIICESIRGRVVSCAWWFLAWIWVSICRIGRPTCWERKTVIILQLASSDFD